MSNRIERLPTPQGIGAGQSSTLALPIGPTYHRLDLRLKASATGGTAADVPVANWDDYIDDIRVIVNGDTKIEATALFMVNRANHFGQTLVAGVLPIFLTMPWARTIDGEDQTAYGTAVGMASFTLEVDFKPNVNIGKFEVYAEQSAPRAFGPHLRIQRFAQSFGAVGIEEVSDLPRGPHNLYGIDITSSNISEIEILADNRRVHVSDKAIRANQLNITKRVQQTDVTHLDFMAENRVNNIMPMLLQDFRLKLKFTVAPGAYDLYTTGIYGA